MKDEVKPSLLIVSSPVIIFFKEDAEKLVDLTPLKLVDHQENMAAVMAMVNPETIANHCALFIVTHWVRNPKTQKAKSKGSWQFKVPIKLAGKPSDAHVFRADFSDPENNGGGETPDSPEQPAPDMRPEQRAAEEAVEKFVASKGGVVIPMKP